MKRTVSKTAATDVLALVRHFYSEEIRHARRVNVGAPDHQLTERASAAALRRTVGALERVAGTTKTLDVPETRRRGA